MKRPKPEPISTTLDPSHPNYDALMLKRARLEKHRRRRAENRGELPITSPKAKKPKPKKPRKGGKGREGD